MVQRNGCTGGLIEPCLPSPAKAPPSGPGWLHEIKHDGFRILARRDAKGVRLYTRNGHDFTARFPLVAAAITALPVCSVFVPVFLRGRREEFVQRVPERFTPERTAFRRLIVIVLGPSRLY